MLLLRVLGLPAVRAAVRLWERRWEAIRGRRGPHGLSAKQVLTVVDVPSPPLQMYSLLCLERIILGLSIALRAGCSKPYRGG